MAAPRFYVEVETEALDKALAEQAEVVLPPKAAHHAGRALRLRTGEERSSSTERDASGGAASDSIRTAPTLRSTRSRRPRSSPPCA